MEQSYQPHPGCKPNLWPSSNTGKVSGTILHHRAANSAWTDVIREPSSSPHLTSVLTLESHKAKETSVSPTWVHTVTSIPPTLCTGPLKSVASQQFPSCRCCQLARRESQPGMAKGNLDPWFRPHRELNLKWHKGESVHPRSSQMPLKETWAGCGAQTMELKLDKQGCERGSNAGWGHTTSSTRLLTRRRSFP